MQVEKKLRIFLQISVQANDLWSFNRRKVKLRLTMRYVFETGVISTSFKTSSMTPPHLKSGDRSVTTGVSATGTDRADW